MKRFGVQCILVALVATLAPSAASAEHFEAWLRDGARLVGQQANNLHDPVQLRLDGKELLNGENPVRRIRDVRQAIRRRGPCLLLTNGDVLPGRVIGWSAGSGVAPGVAHFSVELGAAENSTGDFRDGVVLVRADCVIRIFSADRAFMPARPGLLIARNGQETLARSLRFTATSAEALAESGGVAVDFADIAELQLPHAATTTAVLRDGVWSEPGTQNSVVRVTTAGGAELTFCRPMAALASVDSADRGGQPRAMLAIRPAWALSTLYVDPATLASAAYRNADEIPLSHLPAETFESRAVLHAWPWRRNANVQGGALQSNSRWSDLGVGMHSYSAVAFTLPAGAQAFSTWVGIDAAAGNGGCVRCRIHRDRADGPTLWESEFLRGGAEPVRIDQLNVQGADRLVLVADFGHEGRPVDADPWDVRDVVDWIDPLVTVDPAGVPAPESEPERWIPQLAGWRIPQQEQARLALRPFWDAWRKQWAVAMTPDRTGLRSPFELTRRLRVDLTNAVLPVSAATDSPGQSRHAIHVKVDGDKVDTSMNAVVYAAALRRSGPSRREWSLGPYRERNVELSVVIEPQQGSEGDPMGLVWQSLSPQPLVENLPADGRPLAPEILLTSLTPASASCNGRSLQLRRGCLVDGSPLEIRGWRFEEGIGVPTGSEVTYRLDPRWRRFVAILGLASGWQGAGPYSMLLDGQPYWECTTPASFGPTSPGLQIDVPIPPGHQTITLRVQGKDSQAAWAWAGFLE